MGLLFLHISSLAGLGCLGFITRVLVIIRGFLYHKNLQSRREGALLQDYSSIHMRIETVSLSSLATGATAETIYVDCGSRSSGSGTESWPGDTLVFEEGTTQGVLYPKGSGSLRSPITISSYGEGNLPVIDGQGAMETVLILNQDNWQITNVAITNPASKLAAKNGINAVYNDMKVHSGLLIKDVVMFYVAGQTWPLSLRIVPNLAASQPQLIWLQNPELTTC